MKNPDQLTVSAVIPTLGRESVLRAVESAINQSRPVDEVVIVVAGDTKFIKNLPKDERIRLVFPPEKKEGFWTAAYNRNYGIQFATSTLIALLDDDDCWKPKKIEIQLRNFRDLNTVYSSKSEYCLRSGRRKIRPRQILDSSKGILESYYGKAHLYRSPVYMSTASIMLSRELALKVPQNEILPSYEDTWWLHELQAAGAVFLQDKNALVEINAEPYRSTARETLATNMIWAETISSVSLAYRKNFLTGIALRNLALHGKPEEIIELIRSLKLLDQLGATDLLRLYFMLFLAKLLRHQNRRKARKSQIMRRKTFIEKP